MLRPAVRGAAVHVIVSGGLVTGGSAGTDTITYTHAGCAVNTIVTVNLTPLPISGAAQVCLGDSTTLNDIVTGGVWSSSNTSIATIDAPGALTGVLPGTTTITYSLGAGCAVTMIATVNPIAVITGSLGLCLGTTTVLADGITGGSWGSGATTVAPVNTAGIVTGVLEGTSIITYTSAAGCMATAIVTVNLAPSPISGTLHLCAGATTALGNTAGGGIWTSSNTTIAVVGSTGIVMGIIPGTTTITYSLGFGCTVNAVITVNVVPLGITGTMSMCAGATSLLVDASTGGAWSPASGGIATVSGTGVVSGISTGTAEISYSFVSGCAAIATITVNPQPANITGTTHVCVGLTTILSSTTGGTWTSASVGIATADLVTGMITGEAPGTAVIAYTLPAGCSTMATVTINSAPAAIAGSMTVCIGSTTLLSDPSGSGVWSSSPATGGIASVSGDGVVAGAALGTSIISYTVGGCTATLVLTVNSLPDALPGTNVCAGSSLTLTDLPGGGTWSSSDVSIASIDETAGVITGTAAGAATVSYSLGVGCTVTATVIIETLPAAITGVTEVCLHYTTELADGTGGGIWSSGNTGVASVSGAGVVYGSSGGPALISYTSVATGCAATRLVTVVAVPAISGVSGMCAYSTTVTVSDAVTGGTWTSTSATVSTAGIVSPYAAGIATLTYTIPLGCYVTAAFTVHPLPGPVTGTVRLCRGLSTTLADTSSTGTWSSSNTAVAPVNTAGTVTGLSAGTAIVSYVLPTGCMQTETITVDPVPSSIIGTSHVCAAATITLSDTAAGGLWNSSSPAITTVDMSSGIVTGITAGIALITYSFDPSCSVTKIITVDPLPVVYTVTGGGSYCAGTSGVHIGLSGSDMGISYQLYHGTVLSGTVTGAGTAAGFGVETTAGIYTAIAINATTGCSDNMRDSAIVMITPTVIPTVTIVTSPGDTVCAGAPVTFTAIPLNGGSIPVYQWLVNSTLIPGASSSVYTYSPANGDIIKAMLTSSAPCAIPDTTSASIAMTVVTPVAPTVTINATPGTNIQPGQSVILTAAISNSGPSPTYQWEINGSIVAGATTATFTNNFTTTDTVACIVTASDICNTEGSGSTIIEVTNVGVKSISTNELITLVPNPNNGTFTMKGSLGTINDEEVSLDISNMLGQSIYRNKIIAHSGKINEQISLTSTLPNGMYILTLNSATIHSVFHFVTEQ